MNSPKPSSRSLPGPRGHWLWGCLPDLRRDMLGFFTSCKNEFGDAAYFRVGRRRSMLLSHPDDIERVLVTENKRFQKNFALQFFMRPLLGRGLLLNEGESWLRQRRLIQPAFSRSQIAGYTTSMSDLADRMLSSWQDGQPVDIHRAMMQLTMAIAGKTLLDVEVGERFDEISTCLDDITRDFRRRFAFPIPIPHWVPTPGNYRLWRAIGKLDAAIFRMIDERRAGAARGEDFLSLLIDARDEENGQGMSDRQLRDEVVTMFLAGHETTANALSWTFQLLAENPVWQSKIADEVTQVVGKNTPTMLDLPKLQLCERVVREGMRLYPPAYIVGRRSEVDCQIGEHFIPRRTNVLMSQWVVHRDERWYDDPLRFHPDRWTPGMIAELPKYAYFPFGGGPRGCIGREFAMVEATLLLATVLRKFELSLIDRTPVPMNTAVTLRPARAMEMQLTLRSSKRWQTYGTKSPVVPAASVTGTSLRPTPK
ncbi:cytochrome P450 [Pirellula staleyi DSM 6068]|uniref:Cytochrome P450 n=1 Tax=Pirellula staleyi (strain ATCC 27377 / DSM 6068 / ICPB 4128) TaxID=530564 RepID=D2R697_PIRSD|nr:cytochrome P450 [Pirellula staleyi]ADB15475.1 cytochrome P450 [Pirellula staleyi DSM 6068]